MDFIRVCFEENSVTLTKKLEQVGIADNLARQFLPETASAVLDIIENNNLEKTIEVLLSDRPSQLLHSINTNNMATKLGMSSEQVSSALEAIEPEVSRIFLLKSNEIVAATASLAWKSNDKALDMAGNY